MRLGLEGYRVAGERHDGQIAILNSVHTAIQALDAMIAEDEANEPSAYKTSGLRTL